MMGLRKVIACYFGKKSGQRSQLKDEGEHLLKILDQLVIGGDQLAALFLRQCDVETVVDAARIREAMSVARERRADKRRGRGRSS
jgi:hypothetical protein